MNFPFNMVPFQVTCWFSGLYHLKLKFELLPAGDFLKSMIDHFFFSGAWYGCAHQQRYVGECKGGVHRGKKDTWGRNWIHPGRLRWNLLINHLERKIIFQTSMIMVHLNLPGCIGSLLLIRCFMTYISYILPEINGSPLNIDCWKMYFPVEFSSLKKGRTTRNLQLPCTFVENVSQGTSIFPQFEQEKINHFSKINHLKN